MTYCPTNLKRILLPVALLICGCGQVPEPPPSIPVEDAVPHDFPGVYHFVDELSRDESANIPQATVGRETRMAISGAPETPRHVSRVLLLPPETRLAAGLGMDLSDAADSEPHARYSILMEYEGRVIPLLEELELRDRGAWHEIELDLTPYAGQAVRFTFVSHASEGTEAVWGTPRLIPAAPAPSERRNVILISLDTLRADHLGIYGYERETSPGIDAFAEGAIVYDRAISPSSWTLPAHASLFTGLSPARHGAISMGSPPFVGETLAELAYDSGYRTGGLTDGGFVEAAWGFAQGFSNYLGKRTRATVRFKEALDWIDAADDQPYFLFVHTYQVHSPYRPPTEYAVRFLPEGTDPEAVKREIDGLEKRQELSREHRDAVVNLYDAEVAYLDDALANFFSALQERGEWNNTLIVVFSDHGEQFWEHGQFGHGVSLYEEEIRVPLIVKPVGTDFLPGRRAALVSLTDVFATVAEAMDWPYRADLDSKSFRSSFASLEREFGRDHVISELGMRLRYWDPIPVAPRLLSYRSADWKLIANEADGSMRYYDLSLDPNERTDRFSVTAELLEEYVEGFREHIQETSSNLLGSGAFQRPPPQLTEEQRDELEALGYFQ